MGSHPNFLEGRIQEFSGRQGKRDCNSDFCFFSNGLYLHFFDVKLRFYHVFALFRVSAQCLNQTYSSNNHLVAEFATKWPQSMPGRTRDPAIINALLNKYFKWEKNKITF